MEILIVDDDPEQIFALESLLEAQGHSVLTAASGKEAVKVLKASGKTLDLIISDVNMPEMTGVELCDWVRSDADLRYLPVVLVTSLDTVEDLEKGFDAGADDYLCKPYNKDELLVRIAAVIQTRQLYSELRQAHHEREKLVSELHGRYAFGSLVGKAESMQEVYQLIERVAPSEAPVLITGESGTGKELVARAIHAQSKLSGRTLVIQNCSALNEQLLESELFGHVKGAFTGASRDKKGLFEVADQGTLFLDELGEMPLSMQAKLLRVLQDGTFHPVGSTESKTVKVRVIAATNRNLEEMMAEGSFREDLFYRLSVVQIPLPPLRQRRGDIALLVENFLEGKRESYGPRILSSEVLDFLISSDWPGNIRQLHNELERMLIMSDPGETLGPSHVSSKLRSASSGQVHDEDLGGESLRDAIESLEKKLIQKTLESVGGNKSEAARQLDISRSSLISKVKQYHLEEE